MATLTTATLLGVVEGLTEFLPVSSTGHLILAGYLLDFRGEKASTFEVAIQLGAILAVVFIYAHRFRGLFLPHSRERFSGLRGLTLLALTSAPAALLGLMAHKSIKSSLFAPKPVALALAVGGVMMIIVEARTRRVRYSTLDELTPALALGIGLFQCLSLWPGFSRAAATIMGGMILGANRKLSAEYSFIAAVPIMFAATGYDLLKSWQFLQISDLSFFITGFVVSFAAAWLAVKGFIRLLSSITLRPFAYYRIIFAPLVWFFWPA